MRFHFPLVLIFYTGDIDGIRVIVPWDEFMDSFTKVHTTRTNEERLALKKTARALLCCSFLVLFRCIGAQATACY